MTAVRARSSRALVALILVLVCGFALHGWLARSLDGYLDPDEAVVALMATHIARGQGDWPVFYYGQPYLGALEAYLVAGGFAVGGATPACARVVAVLIWLGLGIATWILARAVGLEAPALAVALVCVVPPQVLLWHTKLRGGFTLGAALLALAVALGVRALRTDSARAVVAFGLVAGLAFWTNQLAAPALAVVGLALVVGRHRVAPMVAAFAFGSVPFWIYNVVHPLATFRYLAGHWLAGTDVDLSTRANLLGTTMAQLCGGATAAATTGVGWLRAVGPLLAIVGVLAVIWQRSGPIAAALRARRQPEPLDLVILALVVSLPVRRNHQLNQFLHLAPLAAVACASLWRRGRPFATGTPRWWVIVPAGMVLVAAAELAIWLPGFRMSDEPIMQLVRLLDERGVRAVYAEHRPTYLIAFHSGGRIAATPSLSVGYDVDRYPPDTARVRADGRPAYVFEADSTNERAYQSRAPAAAELPIAVAGYHVYLRPVGSAFDEREGEGEQVEADGVDNGHPP